jgi:predicted lysophospholipase L1 biosynthesis ABC-type transport system permease subunit
MTVVGVVGDVRENGLAADPEPTVYSLARQRPPSTGLVVVLAGGPGFDPAATMAAASRAVRAVDPGLPVRTRRIEEVFERAVADRRYALVLAGAFGAAALALAAAGLYGVVAYVAAQRRRELGVRVALGARAGDVRRLVLGRGLAPAALGLAAGLAGALAAGRLLAAHLYGVRPGDPATFAGVALALGAVAFAAAWAPARRAARVDPASALRAE